METVTIPPYSELETVAGVDITDVDGAWLVGGHTNMPVLVAAGVVCSLQGER